MAHKDFETAVQLASTLEEYLKDEEIYRVDHYMGKTAVQVSRWVIDCSPLGLFSSL